MLPVGEGAPRFRVKFYLVAMLFVIFDIEVVFMYPWAVPFKELIATSAIGPPLHGLLCGDPGCGLPLCPQEGRPELEGLR